MPPIVSKQKPADNSAPKAAATSADVQGVKLAVYGRGKTGKTRLACSFPKPLLLIGTEDGTKSVCTHKVVSQRTASGLTVQRLWVGKTDTGIDFARIAESQQLEELLQLPNEDWYKSYVLDHAGGYQDLILKEVGGFEEVPLSKFRRAGKGETWGIVDRGVWGTINEQWKERLRRLINLADTHGSHVVIIAHERNFTSEGQGSDMMMPSVGAALTPGTCAWLNGAVDYLCQCFIRGQETEVMQEVAGKQVPIKLNTGKAEYCLRTGAHPIYMTGFRLPPGINLPDVLPNPDYDKLMRLISGEYH